MPSATLLCSRGRSSFSHPAKIDCNQNTLLAWTSGETIDADMSGMSPVSTTGERTISLDKRLRTNSRPTGPGGVTKPSTTVEVNAVVQSSAERFTLGGPIRALVIRFSEQGSTSLSWSVIQRQRCLSRYPRHRRRQRHQVPNSQPNQTANGPVDEEFKYTFD